MLATYVNLHLFVEPVVEDQIVCHPDAVRLHRVAWTIVVKACVLCVASSYNVHHLRCRVVLLRCPFTRHAPKKCHAGKTNATCGTKQRTVAPNDITKASQQYEGDESKETRLC